jgi:dolichol-phosphate mannosyltransferase
MTSVLVVIPTYNELSNITGLIPEIKRVLIENGYSYQVLIVDDNSPDGTAEAVEEMRATDDRVNLLKRPGKLGLGSAYIDGFTWAVSNLKFDVVVQMDADFSHPPQDIARLVEALDEGSDVAVASRYVEGGGSSRWPWYRRLISRGANFLAHLLLGISARDMTSGFRAMRRGAVEGLLGYRLNSRGYSYQVECLMIFEAAGSKVVEVPFTFGSRQSGEAKLSFREVIRFAGFLMRASFRGVTPKEE